MGLTRFARQVQLAAKVIESGGSPPRLDPELDVLDRLGVDSVSARRLRCANVKDQIEIVRPFLQRSRESGRRAKVSVGMKVAERHAAYLRQGLRGDGADLELPGPALMELVGVPAFELIRLESEHCGSWTFRRLKLRRILHSMKGCSSVSVRLRDRKLVISYRSKPNGRGRFVLLDQAVPVTAGVFMVSLVAPPRGICSLKPTTADPVSTPTRTPPWIQDAARTLIDTLVGD